MESRANIQVSRHESWYLNFLSYKNKDHSKLPQSNNGVFDCGSLLPSKKNSHPYPFYSISSTDHNKSLLYPSWLLTGIKKSQLVSKNPDTRLTKKASSTKRMRIKIEFQLIREPSTIPYFLIQHNLPSDATAIHLLYKLAEKYRTHVPKIIEEICANTDFSWRVLLSDSHAKLLNSPDEYEDSTIESEEFYSVSIFQLCDKCEWDESDLSESVILSLIKKKQLECDLLSLREYEKNLENDEILNLSTILEEKNTFLEEQNQRLWTENENLRNQSNLLLNLSDFIFKNNTNLIIKNQELAASMEEKDADMKKIQLDMSLVTQENEKLKKENDSRKAAMEYYGIELMKKKSQTMLGTKLSLERQKNDCLKNKIKDLKNKEKKNNLEIKNNLTALKNLKEENASLKKENTEKNEEIKKLQQTNLDLEKSHKNLKQKVDEKTEELKEKTDLINQKTNENNELLKENKQLNDQIKVNQKKHEETNRKNAELTINLTSNKEENKKPTKTNKFLQKNLDQKDIEIGGLTRQNLITQIISGLSTTDDIKQAKLTADEVLNILSKLGTPTFGEALSGTLLTAKKARAVLIVQNSIQNFMLEDLLKFKVMIDAKKQEDTVNSAYSFIRQEQGLFRCRYGNTKTWETIMGLVKNNLKDRLEKTVDQLTNEKKINSKAIFLTHRQHGYGFGFFSTPEIPTSVKNKLNLTHTLQQINSQYTLSQAPYPQTQCRFESFV